MNDVLTLTEVSYISLATIHSLIQSVISREIDMQASQQTTSEQNPQEKRYEPNEALLDALQAMKQETSEQADYYRGQFEAIFQQRWSVIDTEHRSLSNCV